MAPAKRRQKFGRPRKLNTSQVNLARKALKEKTSERLRESWMCLCEI